MVVVVAAANLPYDTEVSEATVEVVVWRSGNDNALKKRKSRELGDEELSN